MHFRPKRPSDEAFIRGLSVDAFEEYGPDAGPRTLAMTEEVGAATLVAVDGGIPCGFAVLVRDRGGAHLNAIAVDRAHRGRGIGRRLLRAVIAEAHAADITSVRLVTADANVAALELFLGAGFRIETRRQGYYPRGQDAVVMRLTIDDAVALF